VRRLAAAIDALNEHVGRAIAWLALGIVLTQFGLVVARYVFAFSHPALSEAVWYQHGLLFTLAAGYTALKDENVRIDLIYGRATRRQRAWIDLTGILVLLLPLCILTAWLSSSYVLNSWRVLEGSTEISGLPLMFALKTAIWGFAGLLGLQAVSGLIKNYLVLSERGMAEHG
jgi:TRAP-type mannitol/chloroaromatic compound transport system permease small subunit